MSRFCGEVDARPILDGATYWRDQALIGETSVLASKRLWTNEALDALDEHYVQRVDGGEGKFLEKLKKQLASAGPDASQLAAEMMWLLFLCPRNFRPATKRQTLQTIWTWSGDVFPADSPWLADHVLAGIGSAGTGFITNQWRELVFVIRLVRAFRGLARDDQRRILGDAWAFDDWVSGVPDADARQFRHMVLFLLFPDVFERVFGQTDRRAIAVAYSGRDRKEVARLTNAELDRQLFDTRVALERKHGRSDLDFYLPPLKDDWKSESLTQVASAMTRDHVIAALEKINAEGVPTDARSSTYDLLFEGKRYPPKYVFSLAVEAATGEPIDRATFTGGEESTCFKILRDRGFEIGGKQDETDLQVALQAFIEQGKAGTDLTTRAFLKEYRGFRVRVSFGQGTVSNVPWVAWLGGDERVSEGIYPVLLFFKAEGKLLLCYGLSETQRPKLGWPNVAGLPTVREWFNKTLSREPFRYGASYVAAVFDAEAPNLAVLQGKLDKILAEYASVLKAAPQEVPREEEEEEEEEDALPVRTDIPVAVNAFADALLEAGVSFGERHETIVSTFVASLLTKRLVILTGLSGSGKSQLALQLGEWLGSEHVLVAPVRPDWTGADALFGYEDALKPVENGLAAWSVPPTLSFIIRASQNPQYPYLLVLDEMNLAHVERYFADVLSGMESGQPCIPDLVQGSDGCWRQSKRDARIRLPHNLWIVGTVNVDETTYMFSPKVLDRANTLEFRVLTSDLTVNPKKPGKCTPGEKDLIRGLQLVASDYDWHVTRPFTQQSELVKSLHSLHRLLSQFGLEYGHRVFFESVRFGALVEQAGVAGLHAVLDLILLQKVLPRLHGSRRKMEAPLTALRAFCRNPIGDSLAAPAPLPADTGDPDEGALLPESSEKLGRMLRALRANQFVSFSE